MRLKQRDIDAINWAAAETFGPNTLVSLYGSRTDDRLRGGDIDLLIDVPPGHDGWQDACRFREHLFQRIDEQKVDIVFRVRGEVPSAFVRLIEGEAIPLS